MDCPSWSPWTKNDSEEVANGSLFVMYNNYKYYLGIIGGSIVLLLLISL